MLRELLATLNGPERRGALVLALLTLAAALAEAVGIGAVFPFLNLLNNPDAIASNATLRALFELSGAGGANEFILIAAMLIVVIFLGKNAFLALVYFMHARFVYRVEARLTSELLASYLRAPYSARLEQTSAERTRIITTEVSRVTNGFLMPLISVMTEGLIVAALALLILLVQPLAATIAIVIVGATGLLMHRAFRRRVTAFSETRVQAHIRMFKWVSQALGALKEAKVLGREEYFIRQFAASSRAYAWANQTFSAFNLMPRLAVEAIAVTALLGTVVVAILARQPFAEVVPMLTLFGLVAVRMMPSTTRILSSVNNIRYHAPAIRVVASDLKTAARVPSHSGKAATAPLAREHLATLELKHVSFRYPDTASPALTGIDLSLRHGEMIAIVGRSGSGKTTLADLLVGLVEPGEGEISVNGRPVRSLAERWRGMVNVVPQNFFLLDDTVRRNVAFGLPDEEIDDRRVWQALELARLAPKVKSLLLALDAGVGEQGGLLSGGERQRLSIARALYTDPDILVFDEAMSALDAATEAEIMETLRSLAGRKTVLLITHRVASVAWCERVLVMSEGRIVGDGAYPELAAGNAAFAELVRTADSSGRPGP